MKLTSCKCCGFSPLIEPGGRPVSKLDQTDLLEKSTQDTANHEIETKAWERSKCLPCFVNDDIMRWLGQASTENNKVAQHDRCRVLWLPELSQASASIFGKIVIALVHMASSSPPDGKVANRTIDGAARLKDFLRHREMDPNWSGAKITNPTRDKSEIAFTEGLRVLQISALDAEIETWLNAGTLAEFTFDSIERTGAYLD